MGGGGGAQLLLISFATTRLHGICNGSINGIEDGGGGHTLQSHSLGTKDMYHPPQISEFFFVLDREGTQKCFILRDQTTGDFKSYHLQVRVTLTALSVPLVHLFFIFLKFF